MKSWPVVVFLPVTVASTLAWAQGPTHTIAPGAFFENNGAQLYYQECGTGAEAVVLLHDGVVDSAVWDDVWAGFCQLFHTIRYDRRGYGRSPETKNPYYEADDLAALLSDRKIAHAALVASSHGGQVALEFALRYRAYVSHLVVVGPAASGFPYSEYFLMRERAITRSNKVQDLIEASVRDAFLIVPGHDDARKRLRALLEASPHDLTHNDMPLPEQPIFPHVRKLEVPTLILIGSGDIADNHAVAGALVTAIPGAVRIVVPETGHLMYLEKPDEFLRQVNTFLIFHRFGIIP